MKLKSIKSTFNQHFRQASGENMKILKLPFCLVSELSRYSSLTLKERFGSTACVHGGNFPKTRKLDSIRK